MKKECPVCSKEVSCSCGDNYACWCSDLPQIMSLEEHNGCLCADCLKARIEEEINTFVADFKKGTIENSAPEHDGDRKSILEGIDYYKEGKYKVFKEWYHLRRGYCCGNSCRHCPYGDQPQTKLIYVTGGARSGKSSYAQTLAQKLHPNPVYVATARKWDGDFEKRIERHQADRDERWENIEEEKHPSKLDLKGKVVVIDCVTLWLTNFFVDSKNDIDQSLVAFKAEVDALKKIPCTLIIISNEIGMGVHSQSEIGRKFTDLQGWANQYLASKSDQATLMVSGLKVKLK
jgi:adenosylcobinamide kinase/adenosylcobinamide-phosphate guanylyltransferase